MPLPEPTVEDLRAARKTMKVNTGRGLDSFGPADLAMLPRAAEQELLDMMLSWENLGAWHWQLELALIVLAAKPQGGERDIALLGVLVRLYGRLRHTPMREWCAKRAGFWDTGISESQPLRVVLARALKEQASRPFPLTCSNDHSE